MTVYLAHSPNISGDGTIPDFSSAAKFGAIVPILQQGEHPGLNPDFAQRRIQDRLARFDPRTDHILWVPRGDPLALMLIAFELLSLGITEFSWLRYSRKIDGEGTRTGEGQFIPTLINLGGYQDILDARPPI